jgi:hypothetical protein
MPGHGLSGLEDQATHHGRSTIVDNFLGHVSNCEQPLGRRVSADCPGFVAEDVGATEDGLGGWL